MGDDGQEPSTGPLSSSPDVIVVHRPVSDPQTSFGEGSGTENDDALGAGVRAGLAHSVYVRIRNRGGCPAANVTGTVYWSEPATFLAPDWNERTSGGSAGRRAQRGSGHLLACGRDSRARTLLLRGRGQPRLRPPPPLPSPTDWAGFREFLRRSNNVTWLNFNVLDPQMFAVDVGTWFWIKGSPDIPRRFDFEIHARLPAKAKLMLELPVALLPALKAAPFAKEVDRNRDRLVLALPELGPVLFPAVRLDREARHRCRFFVLGAVDRLSEQPGSLTIRQLYEGEEVGRITWVLRPRQVRRPPA